MDRLINILITITLVEMMIAIGLGVSLPDVIGAAKNWRLTSRALLANYVCVPASAMGLLLLFAAPPMVAAGFLITAACPGAPYAPPFTGLAKGNVAAAVGTMVILAGSSAILAPILLAVLLPLFSAGDSLKVDPRAMVVTLLIIQLLPLFVGLALRQWRPPLAARLLKPANRLSAILNLAAISLIVAVQYPTLLAIRPVAFLGMLALVAASFAFGWLLGLPGSGNRSAMAITTAVRNVGVSLVIATGSFPGTPVVTATLAFGLFQTVALALVAWGWGRAPQPIPQPSISRGAPW